MVEEQKVVVPSLARGWAVVVMLSALVGALVALVVAGVVYLATQ